MKNDINEYSSQIKKILIELHNYSYFHGPSEPENTDDRFVGREKIINKLTTLLSYNKTKTGAYLITGFRGAGKSSFISTVLQQVTTVNLNIRLLFNALGYFITLSIIKYFSTLFNFNLIPISIIILILSSIYLYIENPKRIEAEFFKDITNSLSSFNSLYKFFKRNILYNFNIKGPDVVVQRFYFYVRSLYIISIFIICDSIITKEFGLRPGNKQFMCLFILCLIIWIINWTYTVFRKQYFEIKKDLTKHRFDRLVLSLRQIIQKSLVRYIAFYDQVVIKINLGFDDIKEIEVFKIISSNLKSEFKNAVFRPSKLLFIRIFYGILLYIFVAFNFQSPESSLKTYYNSSNLYEKLAYYFPSQNIDFQNCNTYNAALVNKYYSNYDRNNNKYKAVKSLLYTTDFIISKSYFKIRNFAFNEVLYTNSNFLRIIFPIQINYIILAIYGILFLLFHALFIILKIPTTGSVYKRIKRLNFLIDYEIAVEKKISSGETLLKTPGLNYGITKKRRISGIREIEKELLSIFDDIDNIPIFFYKPKFIFVFDELDKVEPTLSISNNELKENSFTSDISLSSRIRQQMIKRFLSNMKYFLSSAKAKFLFIAGREMYDAFLADSSDRSFYIGSIFHDVIYVDSFLSDDSNGRRSDITSTTEEYLCQFLIPRSFKQNSKAKTFSLMCFREYLQTLDFFNHNKYDKTCDKILAFQKQEKIINLLQDFIVTLTHLSNGSPKKISRILEGYVETPFKNRIDIDSYLIVKYYRKSNFFLALGFYDQYRIGLTSYIATPIILSISNSSKGYSDNLLVHAGFMIDHLLKFHKSAFSHRTIEIMPDVIDIHRTAELRSFMNDVINFLNQLHLQKIESGIFSYKYTKKFSNEIAYISKINEEASASYNFTLDESLSTKELLESRIKYQRKQCDENKLSLDSYRALSHNIMLLGDLYFYDEDYNEAITSYLNALSLLNNITTKEGVIQEEVIITYIRNMLKLGLAFEKRKSLASALITYNTLCQLIIQIRNINLNNINLSETYDSNGKQSIAKNSSGELETPSKQKTTNNINKDTNTNYSDLFSSIINTPNISELELNRTLSKIIQNVPDVILSGLSNRLAMFEGIKFLLSPLLARLFTQEKGQLGGISFSDIQRVDSEYFFLTKVLSVEEKGVIFSDFLSRLADILFYKNIIVNPIDRTVVNGKSSNKYIFEQLKSFSEFEDEFIINDCSFCDKRRIHAKSFNLSLPCLSCLYYKHALLKQIKSMCINASGIVRNPLNNKSGMNIADIYNNLLNKIPSSNNGINTDLSLFIFLTKTISSVRQDLTNNYMISNDSDNLKMLARVLSSIGDCYLTCVNLPANNNPETCINLDLISSLILKIEHETISQKNNTNRITHPELIILYYFLSTKLYEKANDLKNAAYQCTKIISFLREYISYSADRIKYSTSSNISNEQIMYKIFTGYTKSAKIRFLQVIQHNIFEKAIQMIHYSHNNISIIEMNKMKEIMADKHNSIFKHVNLSKLGINTDIEELQTAYQQFKLNWDEFLENSQNSNYLIQLYNANFISPYTNINSIYNRILMLNLKAKMNYAIFQRMEIPSVNPEYQAVFKFMQYTSSNILQKINPSITLDFLSKKDNNGILIEFLIVDSIKCLVEHINHVNTLGTSFAINHSLLSRSHHKLYEWSFYYKYYVLYATIIHDLHLKTYNRKSKNDYIYEVLKPIKDSMEHFIELSAFTRNNNGDQQEKAKQLLNKEFFALVEKLNTISNLEIATIYTQLYNVKTKTLNIFERLSSLIDPDNMIFVDPTYNVHEAINHYTKIYETHNNGKAYRDMLEKLFITNDDLNDHFSTFNIALERFKLTNNVLDRFRERLLDSKVTKSIFNADNYFINRQN